MGEHDMVTIIKDMPYRGVQEEWSNTYSLDGTTPTTDAEWKALADAIIASEKTCYTGVTRVVRAMGYEAGSDNSKWSWDYLAAATTVAGTATGAGGDLAWAGDQAGWLRMRVGSAANGKPRYIRKYFHSGYSSAGNPDALIATLRTKYIAHGTLMTGGTLPGGMKWIGPNGTIGAAPSASVYVTTRTLKRRGRRPTPAP